MDKVFFKIVIPNYNNMPYISKCLDSILNLTFLDFKIIIVDDMSTDMSDKFCESYARKYSNKIIYNRLSKKGQAGACRNWAIDYQLLSEYIWFVDSDDWLNNDNVLMNLYHTIIKNRYPDVVRCPLLHYFGDNSPRNRIEYMTADITKIMTSGAGPVKNCIRSCFNYKFKEDRAQWNDVVWFLRLYDNININKIVCEKTVCYTYNRKSITSCTNSEIQLNSKCISDLYKLYSDLQLENYKTKYCNDEKIRMQKLSTTTYKYGINSVELMKHAFVISIDDTRYKLFIKLFKDFTFKPQLSIGSTDPTKSNIENCLASHIAIVKKAQLLDLPYVCIFEDDAYPCINIVLQLDKYLNGIPYDAQLVLLGFSSCRKDEQSFFTPYNRITTKSISGAHAYILFKSAYKTYLDFFSNALNKKIADCNIFGSIRNAYVVNYPLFILYSCNKSMNNHIGYILYGDHATPPKNFNKIDLMLLK